jgi:hypothetical protein
LPSNKTPVVSASSRCTNFKNLNPLDRAQKSPAAIDDTSAACKFQSVFCHENGTSIHPRGLSIAIFPVQSTSVLAQLQGLGIPFKSASH